MNGWQRAEYNGQVPGQWFLAVGMMVLRRYDDAIVVTLLSLMMAFNAYEAAVLCIGSDGHIAIEPTGHRHCADGSHLCASDAAEHRTGLTADTSLARCRGCTDIPLGSETCNDPTAPVVSKVIAAGVLAAPMPLHVPSADGPLPAASVSLHSHHASLRSIVLQV